MGSTALAVTSTPFCRQISHPNTCTEHELPPLFWSAASLCVRVSVTCAVLCVSCGVGHQSSIIPLEPSQVTRLAGFGRVCGVRQGIFHRGTGEVKLWSVCSPDSPDCIKLMIGSRPLASPDCINLMIARVHFPGPLPSPIRPVRTSRAECQMQPSLCNLGLLDPSSLVS
jgi:hypothetical protein